MRNWRGFCIAISLGLTMFFSGCAGAQVADTDTPQVIVNANLDVSQSDIERVKTETEHAVNSICPILGIKKQTITVTITEKGICHTSRGIVYLPIWHIKNKKAAIVHEVTHVVARHSENRFFSEGLAIYFQERFGEDHGFPNFSGVPLDDLVRSNRSRVYGIYMLSNNNDIFTQVGTEQREIAYIQAGSFTNFLVATYGEKKLVELHNSWTLDYRKIYGKDIKELEVEWKGAVLR